MKTLVLIIGGITLVGGVIYLSKPDNRLKLGERLKCESPDGRFVDGGYSAIGDGPLRLRVQVTDEPKPPMKIIQSGTFLEYEPFKKAFDEACKTGKLRGVK